MKDLAIYGAGGFGREIACYIRRINEVKSTWTLLGFFDDGRTAGEDTQYGRILGGMETLNQWRTPIAVVMAIATPKTVKTIVSKIKNELVEFPNIIDPSVTFLDRDSVMMGKGNVIGANSLIACNVTLGDFNLLNWYDQLGHEDNIGNYNVVMPNVNISGGVMAGDGNFFGVKSTVLQYLKIGNDTTIGAASVILKDTEDDATYYGNPARVISRNADKNISGGGRFRLKVSSYRLIFHHAGSALGERRVAA